MTPELEAVLDDEAETAQADSTAAAAAAGQDAAPMDVEDTCTRKMPAVTSATTMDVDGNAGAEEKKDADDDDKKPSADGMTTASSAAAPAPAITIRRNENGSRFCSVGDCQKHGRREAGWMCTAHYRELEKRDPAAAAAAKAAAAATPKSQPVHTTAQEDDLVRRGVDGRRLCDIANCPNRARREFGFMCTAHYRELEKRDPAAAAAAKAAAKATPIRRGHRSVPTFGGSTPGLEDVNTPTPVGTSQRSAKKPRVSSAELSSLLYDGPNGGIELAPRRSTRKAGTESEASVIGGRYPARKRVRTDQAENGIDSTDKKASSLLAAVVRRSTSRSSTQSGRNAKKDSKSPPAAAKSTPVTIAAEIRRNSRGERYCAVESCPKLAAGSKASWMCKAHFNESIDNNAVTDGTVGGTGASAASRSTRSSSPTPSSSTHFMLVVSSVAVGGENEWSGTKEALLPAAAAANFSTSTSVATAPIAKKPAARTKPDFDKLEPLGKPETLPNFPDTGKCQWSFEQETRVLHAKFCLGKHEMVHPVDYEFLTKMMELDHISVVSEGLVDELNPSLWNLRFIAGLAGDEYCHRVRRFSRQIVAESELTRDASALNSAEDGSATTKYFVTHKEEETNISMKLSDYFSYLAQRKACLQRIASVRESKGLDPVNPSSPDDRVGRAEGGEEESFAFTSHDGKELSVNVVNDVLYLIDYDMVRLLPSLHEDFAKAFKAKDFLPGGGECMMNNINVNGRPSMGPNFYVTPPASFTAFHQDGHGTVDSGHVCLSGHNEVIMLRRMPEGNKLHAMSILSGDDKNGDSSYNALYGLPHLDGLSHFPLWPTKEAIEKCAEMNYAPSVFILSPGQMLHINKGRLHAFRKLSPFALPSFDCHAELRAQVLQKSENPWVEQRCISVAWDWEFKGVTAEGINRELVSTLECSKLNREHNVQSLAVPETSILFMARRYVSEYEQQLSQMPDGHQNEAVLAFRSTETYASTTDSESNGGGATTSPPVSSSLQVLRGLLPSLSYVVDRHKKAHENAKQMEANGDEKRKVSVAPRPDAWEALDKAGIDPWGHGDMSCQGCAAEISQCYMHCDGCEKLLSQDFNVCVDCHSTRQYECFHKVNPVNDRRHASINHVGDMKYDRKGGCPCKNGPKCKVCDYCLGCSCRCHKSFTMHLRFMSIEDEETLLQRVADAVGSCALPPDATLARLVDDEEEFGDTAST